MLRRITVIDSGDTSLLPGELVDRSRLLEANRAAVAEGGRPAAGRPELMGITKASLDTDSWLSAASFQETTRVLTEAALSEKEDDLKGLKENVIIGKLIPAGTGLARYRNAVVEPGRPAAGRPELMGITKASLATDSWLSAASFQETTRVLTEAALSEKEDDLKGLKENVIIGKLIPAGTGLARYRNAVVEPDKAIRETIYPNFGLGDDALGGDFSDSDLSDVDFSNIDFGDLKLGVEPDKAIRETIYPNFGLGDDALGGDFSDSDLSDVDFSNIDFGDLKLGDDFNPDDFLNDDGGQADLGPDFGDDLDV